MIDRIVIGNPDTFHPATRRQESLLAPLERRALLWMACRIPERIGPDHLTALGLFALLAAGASYVLAARSPWMLGVASVFIVVNWFGDSLDGTLARVRDRQRPRYGFYVDHVIDAVGATAILAGIAASGLATPLVAAVLLIAFLLFSVETYLATYCVGTFRLSHYGFSPTEMRLLLIAGNVAAIWRPTVTIGGRTMPFFDVGFAIAAIVMVALFVWSSVRNGLRLARLERL